MIGGISRTISTAGVLPFTVVKARFEVRIICRGGEGGLCSDWFCIFLQFKIYKYIMKHKTNGFYINCKISTQLSITKPAMQQYK